MRFGIGQGGGHCALMDFLVIAAPSARPPERLACELTARVLKLPGQVAHERGRAHLQDFDDVFLGVRFKRGCDRGRDQAPPDRTGTVRERSGGGAGVVPGHVRGANLGAAIPPGRDDDRRGGRCA